MPDTGIIVINTGPLLAIGAALGDLRVLERHYQRVIVPFEVCGEVLARGATGPCVSAFLGAEFLEKRLEPTAILPHLGNRLDPGEAAVIQIALNEHLPIVCIDEIVGRRVARLNGLSLTGSLGVLLKALRDGEEIDLARGIQRMREQGIWLSRATEEAALKLAGGG